MLSPVHQALGRHAARASPLLPPLLPHIHARACSACASHPATSVNSSTQQQHQQQDRAAALQQAASASASEQQQAVHTTAATNGAAAVECVEDDWCQRSRLLVGPEGLAKLSGLNVLLVGLGGVGSFAAEFLCRAGVGRMTIVDGDTVDTTNRNRQLPALRSTVGLLKTEVVAQRLADINPHLQLTVRQEFLDPVRAAALVQEQQYHYVLDCIDSVAPKQALLLAGSQAGVPTISSMGAGGRMDPSRVRLADISDTHNDAFAAVVRKRLRKAGVTSGITVVFSDEPAQPASLALTQQQYKRSYFGTSSYIPALFGLYIASHVIRAAVEEGYRPPKPGKGSSSISSRGRKSDRSNSSRSSRSASSSRSTGSRRAASSSNNSSVDSGAALQSDSSGSALYASQQLAGSAAAVASGGSTASIGRLSTASSSDAQEQQQRQPQSAAAQPPTQLFGSYEGCEGVGMGFDGEGL